MHRRRASSAGRVEAMEWDCVRTSLRIPYDTGRSTSESSSSTESAVHERSVDGSAAACQVSTVCCVSFMPPAFDPNALKPPNPHRAPVTSRIDHRKSGFRESSWMGRNKGRTQNDTGGVQHLKSQ